MNRFVVFLCIAFLALSAACNREQDRSAAAPQTAHKEIPAVTTVLATIGNDERPHAAAAPMGHAPTAPQDRQFQVVFSRSGKSVAYTAEKNGKVYVVHNGKAGRLYSTLGEVVLSDDGKRFAYGALADGRWRMVIDGREGRAFNTVASPVFSPDGKHVAYQAMLVEKWYMVVDNVLNSGTSGNYGGQGFNADSSLIAYVENPGSGAGRLGVSDLEFKMQTVLEGVGSPMTANTDRTRIAAVSTENGKQRVVRFSFSNPRDVKKGPLYDVIHTIAFGPDGLSLTYGAEKAGERFLVFNDSENRLPKRTIIGPPVVRPDLKGAGAIIARIDPANQHMDIDSPDNASLFQSYTKGSRTGKEYLQATDLVYSPDSSIYAYVARNDRGWFVVVNGREGPVFDRVVTPVFSPDGTKLVYRARKNGKRFVVIADAAGKTIQQHRSYEQVFQPVFTGDGKSIAYGVKDGNKLIWKVEGL